MYFLPDKSSISKDYTGGKVEYIIFSILNQFIQGGILIANLILPKFLIDGLIDHQPQERILFWIGMIVGNNAIGKITNNYFTGKCFIL